MKTAPWQCLAVDTIARVRDGLRRYLVSCIDPASCLAFAIALSSKASRHTRAALSATLSLLPTPPKIVLSDNGSAFKTNFAQTLETHSVSRWHTCPKGPTRNAHVERFNRTLQESFVDGHEDLRFDLPGRLQPSTRVPKILAAYSHQRLQPRPAGCIRRQVRPVSAWPRCSASWNAMAAASGPREWWGRGAAFFFTLPFTGAGQARLKAARRRRRGSVA
ncbi:MAG: DDE-type integrase/transposase/recombinase [Pseudomonadota bacterium]